MTRKEAVEILEDEMYMIWETESEKAFAMKRNEAFDMAIKALEAMDNTENTLQHVGSVERPKGHWIRKTVDNGWHTDWVCSECGYRSYFDYMDFIYCPKCGADMRWGQE